GIQRDAVVLYRLTVVLPRERRGGLAGAGQPDDQHRLLAAPRRHHLAPRVQRETAALVRQLVPHAQATLLRLAEVVAVEHAGDTGVEIDGDHTVTGKAGCGQVRRVDHRQRGREIGPGRLRVEVQPALHARDVRVGRLDVQTRRHAIFGIVADVAVDDEHVLTADVLVLHLR